MAQLIPFRRPHSRARADGRFAVLLCIGVTGAITIGWTINRPFLTADASADADQGLVSEAPVVRAFGSCHTGGGTNCVVDGDTFWMDGEKIRIADIDAPETHPSRCVEEARLGDAATDRLQVLLNMGPVDLAAADRDTDRYARKLRIVSRGGQSLGAILIDEGLARPWAGQRRPWCEV